MNEELFDMLMKNRLRLLITALSILLFNTSVVAQSIAPRQTECLQWDEAYGQIVVISLIGAVITALVLGLLIGLLFGRQFWWAASPNKRIWVAALLIAFPATTFIVVIWPRLLGFGQFLFSSIDPRYVDCQAMSFGAKGLVRGLIGQGVAAFGQWPAITGLLLGASAIGGVIAWITSTSIVRMTGLEATGLGGDR